MNRTIKFRVWSQTINQWISHVSVIGSQGDISSHHIEIKEDQTVINHIHNINNLNPIIQQFTGFKDKNGTDIYEGDIINFSTNKITHGPEREDYSGAEVFWSDDSGCWLFDRKYEFSMLDNIDKTSIEIVGNIFNT